jgi:hypothetical protein
MLTKALSIEIFKEDAKDIFRAFLWEIDSDGPACILDVCEAESPETAAEFALMGVGRGEAVAVKVPGKEDERTSDAVPCGMHWIVWPDAISTEECAILLATDARPMFLSTEA